MKPEEQAQLDELRQHLTEETQDQSGYLTPKRASQLAALTHDELWRLYRKIAFANQHPHFSDDRARDASASDSGPNRVP